MAKQPSLAAQSGTLSERPAGEHQPLALPDVFMAPQEVIKSRFIAPYIVFCHPKRTDEWNRIRGAYGDSVLEGDMYLVTQDRVVSLPSAKLGLVVARQFWVMANAAGEVLEASFEEHQFPWKEQVESVVLCYYEDRVVPVNMQWRTTKCGAVKTLSDNLREASSPDWAGKSPEHKMTLALPQPFCRFFGIVTVGATRTSKSTGNPYRPAQCTVKPTTSTEWALLKALNEDPATQKLFNDAADRFKFRMTEIQGKVKNRG